MIKVGADFTYKDKGKLKTSSDFISKSRLSDWWNGKAIPAPAKQLDIEKAFPNLATKWFSRSTFSNRFQLHLASLDLNYIDSKDSTYAANEAWSIINKIIADWKPKGDKLEISGPWARSGYDPTPYFLGSHISKDNKDFVTKNAAKEKIKYDLTLGPVSYVDIDISIPLAEIYQTSNPFSIITFMFYLLCMGEDKGNSNYKNDLFLDFLTALNCAHFFIYKNYGGISPHGSDKVATNVVNIFLRVSEYYYGDYWSPKNEKQRHLKRQAGLEKAKAEGLPPYLKFNADLINHPTIFLSGILKEIITDASQYTTLQPNEEEELQALLTNAVISLSNFRKFYINLYRISGLTEEEVVESLLSTFWRYSSEDGSDIRVYGPCNTRKTSPYGWKTPETDIK